MAHTYFTVSNFIENSIGESKRLYAFAITVFAQAWNVLEFRGLSWSPWKLNLPWKVLENHPKTLKSPWTVLYSVGFNTVDNDLNQYKIVVPLFGAAYAAPNKGTTILY